MTCERCGRELSIGQWPYCPHGVARSAIQTNEAFIGGLTIENLGHDPVTVYSREEFKRQMELHGCEQRIKHVPGDKHLLNWAAGIDAQTLANAAALVARGGGGAPDDPAALPSYRSEMRLLEKGEVVAVRELTRRAS